jgi:hypothetical protein
MRNNLVIYLSHDEGSVNTARVYDIITHTINAKLIAILAMQYWQSMQN